jgi:hypothetical protein
MHWTMICCGAEAVPAMFRLDHACIVLLLEKYYLGAFFAAQKTGLCGGSAAYAADGHLRWPRPSNPLRSYGVRRWRPRLVPKHPQRVSIIPMSDILITDFDLILFG